MKVFVYFNLNKRLWSIRAMDGSKKGRVVAHARKVLLENVEFRVSEAGRQRVIRDKRKNVHAGAVGELVRLDGGWRVNAFDMADSMSVLGREKISWWSQSDREAENVAKRGYAVTYNPYESKNFRSVRSHTPVAEVKTAFFSLMCENKPLLMVRA